MCGAETWVAPDVDQQDNIRDDDWLDRQLAPGCVEPDATVASVPYTRKSRPDPQVSLDRAQLTTRQETAARAGRVRRRRADRGVPARSGPDRPPRAVPTA